MKYKCFMLDHDDTLVASSRSIHYPAYCDMIAHFRPQVQPVSIEEFMNKCFNPGIERFYRETYGFNDEELKEEYLMWREYVLKNNAPIFDGLKEVLTDYKKQGGIVVSHTHNHHDIVVRDFINLVGFEPDEIFSVDSDPEYVKPHTQSIDYLKNKYKLESKDMVMMDDLSYGYEMAKKASIDFIAPGFGIYSYDIKEFFLSRATYYIEDPKQLYTILGIKNTIR